MLTACFSPQVRFGCPASLARCTPMRLSQAVVPAEPLPAAAPLETEPLPLPAPAAVPQEPVPEVP